MLEQTVVSQKTAREETATKRRGRPRKVESFADWMARVDCEVDAMARAVAKEPPSYAYLHPAQRRIVQMLIEHMRSLPELKSGEDALNKPEYEYINRITTHLFKWKYPSWTQTTKGGSLALEAIPNGEGKTVDWMLRNCAGRAPVETALCSNSDEE
jgi:hypothetical protein